MSAFKPLTRDEKAAIWWGMTAGDVMHLVAHPDYTLEQMRTSWCGGGDVFGSYKATTTHLIYEWRSVVVHRSSGANCTDRCITGVSNAHRRLMICNPDDPIRGHWESFETVGTYRTSSVSYRRLLAWAKQLPADLVNPLARMKWQSRCQITVSESYWFMVGLLGPREEPVSPIVNRGPIVHGALEPASVPSAAGDQYLLFGGAA